MNKLIKYLGLTALSIMTYSPVHAELRLQRHVPELSWLAKAELEKDEKLEAIIFAPKGLTCRLPSRDGFCRIPLIWLTAKEEQASLWRIDGPAANRVAFGYDGVVDAYLRFGQELQYDLRNGPLIEHRLMDSAMLSAEWDDSWDTTPPPPEKTGDMAAENEGACQIHASFEYCDVGLTWSARHVTTASVWQRTNTGLKMVIDRTLEGTIPVKAYDFTTVYELREGATPDGLLLAATITKGFRVDPTGSINLPDGTSCTVARSTDTCGLRVTWETNDVGRLWLRESPQSTIRTSGQNLVQVGINGAVIDLRSGGLANGAILARQEVSAIQSPVVGSFHTEATRCDIPYADDACNLALTFSTTADSATVWDMEGNAIISGQQGAFSALATDYGTTYHLRTGSDPQAPILATYIAKGIKQSYTGGLKTADDEGDISGYNTCTLNYQRGSCHIPLDYIASDRSTLWHAGLRTAIGGGSVNGRIQVPVYNTDGAAQTINAYELRIHGPSVPRYTDPLLSRLSLMAIRPEHTGSVLPVSLATCNILYSKNECDISVRIQSSSSRVSLWTVEGERLWSGSSVNSLIINVAEGSKELFLKEGTHINNDVLSSLTIRALRPSYFMQLSTPSGDSCIANQFNGTCSVSITSRANTNGRIVYRDITSNPNAVWTNLTNSVTNTTVNLPIGSISFPRTYEIEARQFSSPFEVLDRITVTATLNDQHAYRITSPMPGVGDSTPCTTFHNSSTCGFSQLLTWASTAINTTLCWSHDEESYYSRTVTTGTSVNVNYVFDISFEFKTLDVYEGNVACTSRSDSAEKGQRLLESVKMNKPVVAAIEETPARFNSKTAFCNIVYLGFGSCNVSAPFTVDYSESNHNQLPAFYVRSADGRYISAAVQAAGSASRSVNITEGLIDQEFELRVRRGTTPSDTDPIIDTLVANHGYNEFSGNVFASFLRGGSGHYNDNALLRDNVTPYFLVRKKTGDVYSDTSSSCYLHIDQETCNVYLSSRLSQTTAYASIFVNNEFFDSVPYQYFVNKILRLPVGTFKIEIRDGNGEHAVNNRLLDSFTMEVLRPDYVGAITQLVTVPNVPFHNGSVSIPFSMSSTTKGYLYNTSTDTLLCSITNSHPDQPGTRTASCPQVLGVGEYHLELRTHTNPSHASNKILDRYSVEVSHVPHTIAITPNPTFAHFYSECRRNYMRDRCQIHYQYSNDYAHSSTQSLSVCRVNTDEKTVVKSTSLAATDSPRAASTYIHGGDNQIWFVNGPQCPSFDNPEDVPVLHVKNVLTTSPTIDLETSFSSRSPNIVRLSEGDDNLWECILRFENDVCNFNVRSSYSLFNEPGQEQNAALAVYFTNTFIGAFGTSLSSVISRSQSGRNIIREHSIINCENGGTTAGTCPKTEHTTLKTFNLIGVLPVYVGELFTPDGDYCQGEHRATTCLLRVTMTTDSGHVTLHRDDVFIGSYTTKQFDEVLAIPVKAKGETTRLEIRDGSSQTGRLLSFIEITAEEYDASRFEYQHAGHPDSDDVDRRYCLFSVYVQSEHVVECQFDLNYKSDDAVKYIRVVASTSGVNEIIEVKGNGEVTLPVTTLKAGHDNWSSANTGRTTAHAYANANATSILDRHTIYQRPTVMSEKAFTSFTGLSTTRSNASITTQSYNCRQVCTGTCRQVCSYRYAINGALLMPLYDQSVVVDDLTLAIPPNCSPTRYRDGSQSTICNAIDYLRVTMSMTTGQQRTGTLTINNNAIKVKRLFYRVSTPSVAQYLVDPTITLNGAVRPVNMDGLWHYIDVPHMSLVNADITALNVRASTVSLGIEWFAEYYNVD